MTMAINNSLVYLKKKRIFCTEPHRMKLAGKIRKCVFDKTGTLTEDSLQLKCVAVYNDGKLKLQNSLKEDFENKKLIELVLSGCHSLVEIDKEL